MNTAKQTFTSIAVLIALVFFAIPAHAAKEYRLVKTASDSKIFLVKENRRIHIPNPSVFEAGGYKWNEVKTISQKEMDSISNTALIKSPVDAKVYLITDGKKAWIPNEQAFLGAGLKWGDIVLISQAQVDFYQSADFEERDARAIARTVEPTNNSASEPNRPSITGTPDVLSTAVGTTENNGQAAPASSKNTPVPTGSNPVEASRRFLQEKIVADENSAGIKEQVTDVGSLRPEAPWTSIIGINNKGDVVGYSLKTGHNSAHPFLFKDGVMKDIGNGSGGIANAVNDAGQVVGQLQISFNEGNGSSVNRAFLWENGKITKLSGLQGAAVDINNKKQVVGYVHLGHPEGYPMRAFIWENGIFKDLGTLGGNDNQGATTAHAINDSGQIVGCSVATDTGVEHPFLWENGKMKDLFDSPYYLSGCATDINNSGQIIGFFNKKDEKTGETKNEKFLWENGNVTTFTEHGFSPSKINNNGDILGTLNDYPAILKNGNYYRYKEINGWQIHTGHGISFNDNWQVVANGSRSGNKGTHGIRASLIDNMPPVLENLNMSIDYEKEICAPQKNTQDCVGTNYTKMRLTWKDEDIDNDAAISLYYYEDYRGAFVDVDAQGILITDTIKENDINEYVWDIGVSNVMQRGGQYAVYAVIDDGVHGPKKVYSEQMKHKLYWWDFCKAKAKAEAKSKGKPYVGQYSEEEQIQMGGCSRNDSDAISEGKPPQELFKEKPVEAIPVQPKPIMPSVEEIETLRKDKILFYVEELNKKHPVDASASIRNLGPTDIELDYTGNTYTITWEAPGPKDKRTLALYYTHVNGNTPEYELIKKLIPRNAEKYVWDVSQLPKGAYTIQAYFFDHTEYIYARGAVDLKK